MADGEDKKTTKTLEMENLSLSFSSSSSSKNLLHRFMGSAGDLELKSDENEDVELNLGLSLGGRFGVDRTTTKITRSSSIATYLPVASDDCIEPGGSLPAPVTPPAPPYTGLARSSSLPVESEVDYRKRKELQSLRRMEAKRRRCEKQRNLRGEIATSVEEKKEAEASPQGKLEREKSLPAGMRRPPGLMRAGSISSLMAKVRELGCLGGQGSNLESIDLESTEAKQGSSGEPSLGNNSIQSLTEGSNQEIGSTSARPGRPNLEGPPRTPRKQGGLETGTVALEDMPCVFTNPNGRRVDGILYKYVRGEEVRILCVCHGNFHSPSGFVKHAGGPDVDNPLRLITVNNHVPPLV